MNCLKVAKSVIPFLVVTAGLSSSMSLAAAGEDLLPREVTVGLSDVYVPTTNRRNENAFVVVSGVFPNGCYRWSRGEVNHTNNFAHEIRAKAFVNPGMCLMVLVPFTREVRLGELSSGDHKLRFVNDDGTYLERFMRVE